MALGYLEAINSLRIHVQICWCLQGKAHGTSSLVKTSLQIVHHIVSKWCVDVGYNIDIGQKKKFLLQPNAQAYQLQSADRNKANRLCLPAKVTGAYI